MFCSPDDLGIGYCHTHGMGYTGSNVTAAEVLGDLVTRGTVTRVKILWAALVSRPACVDTLTIRSGIKGDR